MDEVREVMTAQEAADYLQIHIKTLHDWIKSGELKASKLGPRSTRILKKDILSFLEAKASQDVFEGSDQDAQVEKKAVEMSRKMTTRNMKSKVAK